MARRGRKRKTAVKDEIKEEEGDKAGAASTTTDTAQVQMAEVAATEESTNDNKSLKKKAPRTKQTPPLRNTGPPPSSEEWNRMLYQLLLYRADCGDTHVTAKDPKHSELFTWAQELRKQYKIYQSSPEESHLTEEQIRILQSLPFHWHTRGEEHWKIHYDKLKAFKSKHGHCMVPRINPEEPKLGDWVCEQRRQHKLLSRNKQSTMTLERKKLLDSLGFVWQLRHRPEWHLRYDELVTYKKEHGDTLVPQFYEAQIGLGKWVAKQREQYKLLKDGKHSFLTEDRLELLNSIGFCWSIKGRVAREAREQSARNGKLGEGTTGGVVPWGVAPPPGMPAVGSGESVPGIVSRGRKDPPDSAEV